MHSLVIVLLPPDTRDVRKAVAELVAPYRIDEDAIDTGARRGKWDYWTMGPGWKEQYGLDLSAPPEIAGEMDEDLVMNVCRASRLPVDIGCGGIVEPDGAWHEPEDFGWRMLNSLAKNAGPLAQWKQRSSELLSAHRECLAVLVDCHC